ncbi:MAG: membrane protein insertase YidC, partial [Alphaproteobacteria bacterium]
MEQRNLILAIVLSVSILLGYQVLVEGPRMEQERALREAQKAQETTQTTQAPQPGVAVPPGAPAAPGIAPVARSA